MSAEKGKSLGLDKSAGPEVELAPVIVGCQRTGKSWGSLEAQDRARLAALDALRENAQLKVLVAELAEALRLAYKGERCDHQVGVCYCGIYSLLERASELGSAQL